MRLTDRISQANYHAPVEQPGAFLGGGVWRPRDEAVESTRDLKIKVHNRLFETMDVSRMEMLDSGADFGQSHGRNWRDA